MQSKKAILAICIAAVWISVSEFARNELLFKSLWVEHYHHLGLSFPDAASNGAIWGLWSLLFAVAIFILSKKFSLLSTTLLAWFMGFVMMWLVIGNLAVLPYSLLYYAIPLSLLESWIASWIIKKIYHSPVN